MKTEEGVKENKKIVIMGNDVCQKKKRQGGSTAGIVFIVGGIILLLNTLDVLPWTVWDHVWPFWPLFLIYWGLLIILGWMRWLASLAMFVLVILVGMFAIHQVMPNFLSNLPPIFYNIFDIMKGLQK
jgi:hypothetical protein